MSIWVVTGITYLLGFLAAALEVGKQPLVAMVVAPIFLAPFAVFWRRLVEHRGRWFVALPPVEVGAGYRGQAVVPGHEHRVPLRVRIASLSCLVFGVQFVPGLALGLAGLFAGGLGVMSIPGLYVAHEMWRAGTSVLEKTPLSLAQAARAATVAQMLNVILVVGFGFGLIWSCFQSEAAIVVAVGVCFGMAVSALLHALWLGKVVKDLTAEVDAAPI